MALDVTFTGLQLSGAGSPIPPIPAGDSAVFIITRNTNLTGSGYFTVETVGNNDGFYDSTSPTNALGSYDFSTFSPFVPTNLITSSYVSSVIVNPQNTDVQTYVFQPTSNIAASSSMLRSTGDISLRLVLS
jgi:hypothetical protein